MSAQCEATLKAAKGAPMNLFERWLTLWVFLCIAAGITLGRMGVARVNIPVGLLIWAMIVPMLAGVPNRGARDTARRQVGECQPGLVRKVRPTLAVPRGPTFIPATENLICPAPSWW